MKTHPNSTFLPVEKYSILTSLSQEEAMQRLYQVTDLSRKRMQLQIPRFPQFKKTISTYTGTLSKTDFKISRNISYQNSFLPVIEGTIGSFSGKTEIRISMKLHILVKVFMIIWLSLTGLAALGVLIVALNLLVKGRIHVMHPMTLIPIGMFLFGYMLMLFTFKIEAGKSKRDLNALFEGEFLHLD